MTDAERAVLRSAGAAQVAYSRLTDEQRTRVIEMLLTFRAHDQRRSDDSSLNKRVA